MNPPRPLSRRSAIVTGSTAGIGLCVARALAEAGANVMLNGIGPAREIESIRAALAEQSGVEVLVSGADVGKLAQVGDMVAQATRSFGAVDILVNSADLDYAAPIEAFPGTKWDTVLATNLSSSFHAIKAVLPQMRHRNWGRIVNVAAPHGDAASAHRAASVAASHGVIGLTRVVAMETDRTGITCNAICPGAAHGAMPGRPGTARIDRDRHGRDAARSALPRGDSLSASFDTPAHVGSLVVFLCSDSGAQIRGALLNVDGGWQA